MTLYDTLASQPQQMPDLDAIRAAADAAMAASAIHEASSRYSDRLIQARVLAIQKEIKELKDLTRAAAVCFILGAIMHAAAIAAFIGYLKQ